VGSNPTLSVTGGVNGRIACSPKANSVGSAPEAHQPLAENPTLSVTGGVNGRIACSPKANSVGSAPEAHQPLAENPTPYTERNQKKRR